MIANRNRIVHGQRIMSLVDPNWLMLFIFLYSLAVMGFVMKFLVLIISPPQRVQHPYLFWLLLCPDSHKRLRSFSELRPVLWWYGFLFIMLPLSCWGYNSLIYYFDYSGFMLSYAAAPILFLMSESLVGLVTLLWLPSGKVLPSLHDRPWLAQGIGEFWGRRWNLWFSDWARYTIFQPMRREFPLFALLMAFTISGIFHEWVINCPLFFVTGKPLFGGMMLYFLIQATGIYFERALFKKYPKLKRPFTFCVVMIPLPLVINEGLLRIMHLWPNP